MTSPPEPDQPGPDGPQPGPSGPQGYVPSDTPQGQPGAAPAYYWPPQPPDHPDATSTLVIGLISIIGTFICFLPAVLGPWAWIRGRRVIAEIDSSEGQLGGRGVTQAGYIMGIIASVLLGIGLLTILVAVVIVAIVGAGSSTYDSTY